MFMMSFRLRRRGLLIGCAAIVLAAVLGAGLWGRLTGDSVEADAAVSKSEKVKKANGKTNENRLAFIASFGWETESEPVEIIEVIIPKEFDEVYEKYNNIQKKQGLDLKELAGKRVKKYSYAVTNYPGGNMSVRINLLVYKNKIVGGDVCSLDTNGFIHGFAAPV